MLRLPGMGLDTQGMPIWGLVVSAWLGTDRQIDNDVSAKGFVLAPAAVR